jgi:phosphoglycolate phosphatase-like HAD superfamily hydrolase
MGDTAAMQNAAGIRHSTSGGFAYAHLKNAERRDGFLEVYDFDGVIGLTINGTADRAVDRVLRLESLKRNEHMRTVTMGLLFTAHEMLGRNRDSIIEKVLNGVELDGNVLELMREHRARGAKQIVLTGNENTERIREKLLERGINVEVVYRKAREKPAYIKELMEANPGKTVVHINDSLWDLTHAMANGQSKNFVLVQTKTNQLWVPVIKTLNIAEVCDPGSMASMNTAIMNVARG